MSRLIESIRFAQGRFENLRFHQQRISSSMFELFGKRPRWDLASFLAEQNFNAAGVHRCRVVYDERDVAVSFEPYTIRPVVSLRLVEDNSIMYGHKFEDRRALESIAGKRGTADDVLIVQHGLITDTSFANLVFLRDDNWYTPASFLLNGTMRQQLLESGMVQETRIGVQDLPRYESFKLVNAMLAWDARESHVSNIS